MKYLRHLLVFILAFYAINAQCFNVDGINYNITNSTEKTVSVEEKYSGKYTGDIVIPESVTYNGTTYNVTSVGVNAFYECTELTSVKIPNSVTSIEDYSFYLCTQLVSIEIPQNVVSIGRYAFGGCARLENVTIPNSVTNIGEGAFYWDYSLVSIRSFIQAENLFAVHENTFYLVNESCKLYVPHDAINTYKATEGWGCIPNIEELKYKVTYLVDNEVYAINYVAYRGKIPVDIKEGYTFVSDEIPSIMPAEDITVSGSFTVNSYNVTFTVDGEIYKCMTVEYGAEIPAVETPTKEFHTFSGWSEIPSTMPAEDIIISGSFIVNCYKVTYLVDGIEYQTQNVAYGAEIPTIETPKKEGHTFSGWSEAPATMPAEDITISGSFSVNDYVVTYIVDGEVYKTDSVTYGTEIILIDEPTKEGHTFSGWSEIPSTMPAEDIVISGSFSVNSYTVTYVVDGVEYQTQTVAYGTEIPTIETPTKEGHTFSGWSEVPSTMPAEDIIVSGSFTVNNYTVTYIVDGEVYKTVSVVYGADIVLIDEPTKEGHTFSGWSEAPSTMPAEDITISGSFTVNSYTVTFTVDGEVYKTMSVEYGKEIPTVETPTKEGRKFSGWSEIPSTMPAKNVNVEGGFCYTIIYMLDGKYYNSSEIYYGSVIKAPAEPPHKEGHTFVEWGNLPATMPARDMTIHAVYSVNKYQLIFIIDGEVYETLYVEYGSKIEYPQKEGYVITWETEDLPETMPAENLIIIGTSTLDTAIKGIHEVHSDYIIYTLDGHRVLDIENLRSGFYIINGKKVFVK